MNSAGSRVTTLITEHLGFAPLTLIDEIINDVNTIMYKCTVGLVEYLESKRDSQIDEIKKELGIDKDVILDKSQIDPKRVFSLEEIELGAASLETLMVSHVDKNFDKFELYTLRNIFTIPPDLVQNGWVRLKHHENINKEYLNAGTNTDLDAQLKPLVDSINFELQIRKLLMLQKAKAERIVELLRHYRTCVEAMTQAGPDLKLLPETISILKNNLMPMNEHVYYLLDQVDKLLRQVLQLNDRFANDKSLAGMKSVQFGPSARDTYIREKSLKILDEIGILSGDPKDPSKKVLYSAYAQTEK